MAIAEVGQWILAGAVAVAVSASELASRYRDEPFDAVRSQPGLLYCGVNCLAALGALFALSVYGSNFGITGNPDAVLWMRGFMAGTGASALFRSALFTVRIADKDVAIGPVSFLQVLLQVVDREVDRIRARDRSRRIADIMTGVSFSDVSFGLPTFCMVLMQNLDPQQQQEVGEQITKLRATAELPDQTRLLILGLYLTNAIGMDTLEEVMKTFRQQLPSPAQAGPVPPQRP